MYIHKNLHFRLDIELDNSSHVGGISYDYINDLVYVTGSHGVINVYSYPELIGGSLVRVESELDISKVLNEMCSAATLYFYDNNLYRQFFLALFYKLQ